MASSWHSYPKVYALGHKAVQEILLDPVIVEEKIDGSQFSFGRFLDDSGNPYLRCRSRGAELHIDAPDKMFQAAVSTALSLFPMLETGWTYRAEYLMKPKHNALAYDRIPRSHLILFDINHAEEAYLDYNAKSKEAERLGLDVVPRVHEGRVDSLEFFRSLLDRTSILGGQKIEGVVVKNYQRFGLDKKALIGKFVSEAYKEVHGNTWREENPTSGDILTRLIEAYKTPARWAKAVQHLREVGQLEDSPKDIGRLIPSARHDIANECGEEIKTALWNWAWPHVSRGCVSGIAEWYKEELLKKQFGG